MRPGKNTVAILVSCTFLLIAAFILLAVESKGAVVESRIGFVFLAIIALLLFMTVFFAWISPKDTPSDGSKARKVNQPPVDI
jgi:hypothetical protein